MTTTTPQQDRAQQWLERLREIVPDWKEPPAVAVDEADCPEWEWWNGKRSILLTTEKDRTWALKAWGANMITEMEEINLATPEDFLPLWTWLWESEV